MLPGKYWKVYIAKAAVNGLHVRTTVYVPATCSELEFIQAHDQLQASLLNIRKSSSHDYSILMHNYRTFTEPLTNIKSNRNKSQSFLHEKQAHVGMEPSKTKQTK